MGKTILRHNIKFLKLHFVKKILRSLGFAGKLNNSIYSLVPRLYEIIEFSSTIFPNI